MYYTISDFAKMYGGGVRLIAGSGGMSRPIKNVGILDYELDAALKDRYTQTNFQEGQLILTSFLYAKENPFLISEAVKHLVARGASGLAVRNVFRLPIPDAALRYADSKNFPVFLINSMKIYFEDVIYEVRRLADRMKDIYFPQSEIERAFACGEAGEEAARCARSISPSFEERYFAIYFHGADYFGESDFMDFYERYEKSGFFSPSNRLCLYRRGAFFFYSGDAAADGAFIEDLTRSLNPDRGCAAGVSRTHFSLREFGECAREALYASLINGGSGDAYHRYEDIGIYRALFPSAESAQMKAFRAGLLDPLAEYDIENGTVLLTTLESFVASGCSMRGTAAALGVHENTLRYRLERIAAATGLSCRSFEDLEQLSLAVKSGRCAKLLAGL